MAFITGHKAVMAKLNRIADGLTTEVEVQVGYTQHYAIYVHENVNANFKKPGSQAKYLEAPARVMAPELGRVAAETYEATKDLGKSLKVAGLRLQRASQKIVPVEFGFLKNSAFTKKTKG